MALVYPTISQSLLNNGSARYSTFIWEGFQLGYLPTFSGSRLCSYDWMINEYGAVGGMKLAGVTEVG
jgi:hypothetical protein